MKKVLQILIIFFLFISTETGKAWNVGEVSIHGFASTGYMRSDHNNFLLASEDGSFEFNEVGINLGTAITENIRVGIQLYSFDLGDIGNNDVSLDWAFLDYEWKEWLGLRVGKIKIPYGLYNETQDYDMLRTCILLPQSVYHKYLREVLISTQGMALYGKLPLSRAGKLKYNLFFGTSEISNDGGLAKQLSLGDGPFKSGTLQYIGGSRLTWLTPIKGLKGGANYVFFSMDYLATMYVDIPLSPSLSLKTPIEVVFTLDNPYIAAFSLEYDFGKLNISAEYFYMDFSGWIIPDLSQWGLPPLPGEKRSIRSSSYYTLISYRLTNWLELGSYYSIYYQEQNHDSDELTQRMKDLALSARFDINQSWLVKGEIHLCQLSGVTEIQSRSITP